MEAYKDLELQLNQYIDNQQCGAFLISGAWGSGKTFFIKEYIDDNDFVGSYDGELLKYKEKIKAVNKSIEHLKKEQMESSNNELKDSIFKLEKEIEKINNEINNIEFIKTKISNDNKIIKEKLKSGEIESSDINNKQFLYISLNGVSSIEEIAHMIFSQIYVHITGFIDNKVTKIIEKALSACSIGIGNVFSFNFDFDKIFGNIDYMDYIKNNAIKKYVLVFDDFERCKIEISELLGFINRFIEEKNIKVIIIGNEEEIENSIYNADRQSQFIGGTLIACANMVRRKDDINDNTKESSIGMYEDLNEIETNEDDAEVTYPIVNDIQENIKTISSNLSIYSIIKEKFIGQTYYFTTDYKYVISEMTKKCKTRDSNFSNRLFDIVNGLNLTNMRVLSTAIEKISLLYKNDALISDLTNSLLSNVEFCIVLATYSLSALSNYNLAKKSFNYFFNYPDTIDLKQYDNKFKKLVKQYKNSRYKLFNYICIEEVFDFVYHGNNFSKMLESLRIINIKDNAFDSLFTIWEGDFNSGEELTNCFVEVLNRFEKYSVINMIKIFYKYGEYVYKYKFPEIEGHKISQVYDSICYRISTNSTIINETNYYMNEPVKELETHFYNFRCLLKNSKCLLVVGHLFDELKNNNTKIDFEKYIEATCLNNGFFSLFDFNDFKKNFSKLSISQMSRFYNLCTIVYDGDDPGYIRDKDLPNLHLFIDYLEGEIELENLDLLKKKVINNLLSYLKNIVQIFENTIGALHIKNS